MGTSLYVQPFASLPNFVGKECKRVLINRERVGNFKFNDPTNKTDVFYKVRFEKCHYVLISYAIVKRVMQMMVP